MHLKKFCTTNGSNSSRVFLKIQAFIRAIRTYSSTTLQSMSHEKFQSAVLCGLCHENRHLITIPMTSLSTFVQYFISSMVQELWIQFFTAEPYLTDPSRLVLSLESSWWAMLSRLMPKPLKLKLVILRDWRVVQAKEIMRDFLAGVLRIRRVSSFPMYLEKEWHVPGLFYSNLFTKAIQMLRRVCVSISPYLL